MRRGLAAVAVLLLLAGCAPTVQAEPGAPTLRAEPAAPPYPDQLQAYYQRRWADIQVREPDFIPPFLTAGPAVPDSQWLETVLACFADFRLAGGDRLLYDIGELTCEMEHPSGGGLELDYSQKLRDSIYASYQSATLPCLRLGGQPLLQPPILWDFSSGSLFSWFVPPETQRSPQRIYELARCGLRPASSFDSLGA